MNERHPHKPRQEPQRPLPPHDLEAEAAVVSSVFLLRSTSRVAPIIPHPSCFWNHENAEIYRAQLALDVAGRPIDLVTVKGHLASEGRLEAAGGVKYLASVIDATPAVANVEEHAKIVRQKWKLRQAINTFERYAVQGYNVNGQSVEFLESAARATAELCKDADDIRWPTPRELVEQMRTPMSRVSTGVPCLDAALRGGMPVGRLLTIVGQPGASKTTLAFQIAMAMRDSGALVYVCAYDEESFDLLTRLGRHRGLSRADLEGAEDTAIAELADIVSEKEWLILDGMQDGALDIYRVAKALVERAKETGQPPVLVTDSIQYTWVPGIEDALCLKDRIDLVMRALTTIRSMGVLVIATCEANRGLYKARGKRPEVNLVSAGMGSGSIEYRSNAVLVLTKSEPDDDECEPPIRAVFAKNRVGIDDQREIWFALDKERSLLHEVEPPIDGSGGPRPRAPREGHEVIAKDAIAVESFIRRNEGCNKAQVMVGVKGISRTRKEAALDWLKNAGRAEERRGSPSGGKGGGNRLSWYLTTGARNDPTPGSDEGVSS